jgi:hypothetical protein
LQYIVQNSWGKNYGINKRYDIVHTDLECDLGIISQGEAMIPVYESSASKVTKDDTFSADGDVNTTSAEMNTESDGTSEKSNDEALSPGTRILKHQMVTFVLILPFLF